jgi:proline iminopeptidase
VEALLLEPRTFAAWALTQINPRAAHAFAGDRELDARFDRIFALLAPGLFCDPELGDEVSGSGTGFYANQVTKPDRDLRPALRDVHVPALVLKGSCDYEPWSSAIENRDTLPNATLIYLPGAGHQAYIEQPEPYFAAVRAFLLDQPSPIAPYTEDAPPPDSVYADMR